MSIITVHALDAGHLTLPERFFVTPHDDEASKYVPSLSFLIQHTSTDTNKTTRILFDLGLRRDLDLYPPALKEHCRGRSPIKTHPDVVESLAKGGLKPEDIDYIILSHVHYDHIGYPKDFFNSRTKFIIGPGAHDVLTGKITLHGTHSVFEPDLLPLERTIDLPPIEASWIYEPDPKIESIPLHISNWTAMLPFHQVMDIFGDSSVYIVNTPGHLPGHISLLCRISPKVSKSDPETELNADADTDANADTDSDLKYVLLAGDACHDTRLLQDTHSIATWEDEEGQTHCIHADISAAEQTIKTLKEVHDRGFDIIPAGSTAATATDSGTGKFMTVGDQTIEIQKGWYGDPRAQDPGRMDYLAARYVTKRARVEVVLAHDDVWEKEARAHQRFWPGQL